MKTIYCLIFTLLFACACTQFGVGTSSPESSLPETPEIIPSQAPELVWIPTENNFSITIQAFNPSTWIEYFDGGNETVEQYDHIVVDSNGSVWAIGASIGVVKISNGMLEIVEPVSTRKGNPTAVATAGSDEVWVGYENGIISHYSHGLWTDYDIGEHRITAIEVQGEKIWVGSYGEGILVFNGIEWEKTILDSDYVLRFASTPDNKLWASLGCSLGYYDGDDWRVYESEYFAFPCGESIRLDYLTPSPDGSIWFKVIGYGLVHFQPFEKQDVYTEPSFITSSDWATHDLLAASNGVLWIGGADDRDSIEMNAVSCFNGRDWITIDDLPFTLVMDIAESPDGSLWFATANGIYHYLNPNCESNP